MSLDKITDTFAQYMDDDGLLHINQLECVLQELDIPIGLAPALGKELDPNQTGKIDFEDFVAGVGEIARPVPIQVFNALAENGVITQESLKKAASGLCLDVSSQDIQDMIGMCGTDSVTINDFTRLWSQLNDML